MENMHIILTFKDIAKISENLKFHSWLISNMLGIQMTNG